MVERPNIRRGRIIGEKIRKILLNCDLRLVYGKGQLDVASADFTLHARLGKRKKALYDKAKRECYKRYIKQINDAKHEVSVGVEEVLNRYTPVYKKIWIMYFLEQKKIEEIASACNYSYDSIRKITEKLKTDLSDFYKDEEKENVVQ